MRSAATSGRSGAEGWRGAAEANQPKLRNKLAGRRRRALWQLTRRLGSALQPRTRLFPIGYKGGFITFNVQHRLLLYDTRSC